MPKLVENGRIYDDFGTEFETWFSKRFAYRSQVVDAFSALRERVFSTGNDQVIVGEEGFLFFADTLPSFERSDPMSDEEISAAASALSSLSTYAKENGAQLLFVCAPNKNTVYAEYMPRRYGHITESSDLDRLYACLDESTDVSYLDLRPVLENAKSEGLLYHKRDSHWNGRGAHTTYEAIMAFLSLPTPDFSLLPRSEVHTFEGDLDRLLYPGTTCYDDNLVYDYTGHYIYTSAFSNEMDLQITTRSGGKAGDLLMFRDSFGSALIGDLAVSFANMRMERAVPYRLDLLKTEQYDVVIIEIAERNLRTLIGADARITE